MMNNILEQNNNDPLGVRGGGGSTNSDPLGVRSGGGGTPDNDPLKLKSGANDPLKLRTPPTPAPVTSNVFDCLTKADAEIKPKACTTKYMIDNSMTGLTWVYWDDGDFSIKEKDNLSGTSKFTGKWKCTADGFVIDLSNGDHWDSKTAKWSGVGNTKNGGGGGSTVVDTTLTGDELKGGKFVKIGMKGKIVGDIQRLLIKLGYTDISKSGNPDDIFGRRTKASVVEFQRNNQVKDDGAVGPETWPKLNDPAAIKKGASGASSSTSSSSAVSSSDSGETEPGSDIIIKESLRKSLRKNLLKFN
jgi:N-acetylmuramoyl-L-alanine amidase